MGSQTPGLRRASIPIDRVRSLNGRPASADAAALAAVLVGADAALGGDLSGTVGDALIVDGVVDDDKLAADNKVGSLADLTTDISDDVVAAINELDFERRFGADVGRGYSTPGAYTPTFPAGGAWSAASSVSWNLPGSGGAAPGSLLRNTIGEWPSGASNFDQIRPYRAGNYRLSATLYGTDGAPGQTWTASTLLIMAVYLNGTIFDYMGAQFVDAANLPGDILLHGSTIVPIANPQDPDTPGTAGDIIDFRIRAAGGASQTLASSWFSWSIDWVGPAGYTDA